MKRNVTIAVIANLIFGIMPVYWQFLAGVSNVYVLGHRMVWSIVLLKGICYLRARYKDQCLYYLRQSFYTSKILNFLAENSI